VKSAFLIAWRGLWRGKTLWTLLAAVLASHFILRGIVRSDGTDAGEFEMTVRIVYGAVATIIYVAALAIGGGMFAKEREDDLLPLSLVRPSSAFSVAFGKWLSLLLLFSCVIVSSTVLLNVVSPTKDFAYPDCRMHISPKLPPAEVSAAQAMETFLKDEKTPEAVKKSPRTAILALLTAKENERYEVVRPGQTVSWPFPEVEKTSISVKTRFSTMYSLKSTLNGIFKLGASVGIVSNNTQAILEVPLVVGEGICTNSQTHLSFTNTGKTDVMLRPRRDIELLVPYDSFLENSIRASVEVLSLAGLLAAFGLFLSAALSRPVSLFTASVLLAASLMAPDAVSQFPDEFNATIGERLGLAISRVVVLLTSAVSDMSPVSDLATGKAVVYKDMVHAIAYNLVLFPAILLALTAFVLRRKTK
jgi:ABC-type transport system involved in multi-copper enzyme maturation permease subunit